MSEKPDPEPVGWIAHDEAPEISAEPIELPGAGAEPAPDPEPAGATRGDAPVPRDPLEGVDVEEVGRRALGFLFATSMSAGQEALGRAVGADLRVIEVGVGSGPEGSRCLLDIVRGAPPEAYVGLYPFDNERTRAMRERFPEHEFRPGNGAGDDADSADTLAVVDLSGGTWDLRSASAALRKLAPGGFLIAIVPGIEGPGGIAVAEAAVAACATAGFAHANMVPLIADGDRTMIEAVFEVARAEEDLARRGAMLRSLVEEVALRAERYGRAPYGRYLAARWRVVIAIKARGRIIAPPPRRVAGFGS